MKTKILSLKNIFIFSAIFSVAVSTFLGDSANAAVFSRAARYGYFTNQNILAPDVPESDVFVDGIRSNDINSFVSTMKGHLNAGGRRRTAASFIINTMLGNMSGQPDWRNMTSSDSKVSTWEDIVRGYDANGWIDWSRSTETNENTYYWDNDIMWYPKYNQDPNIVFMNGNGTPLYQIRRDCGNPVGTLNRLPPPPNWSSTRNSYVSVDNTTVNGTNGTNNPLTVYPGQTVRFRHAVTASGTGINYATNINGEGHADSNFNGQPLYTHTRLDGRTGNTNHAVSVDNRTQMTFSVSDVGRTYCQRLWMNRISHTSATGGYYSDWRCVRVESRPWQLTATTEVKTSRTGANWTTNNITVYPGETIDWRHRVTNNSGYDAPAASRSEGGWGSFGAHMRYGLDSGIPSASTGAAEWVRFAQPNVNGVGSINNNTTRENLASGSTWANGANDGGLSGGSLSNTYSRNNNGNPPTSVTVTAGDIGKRFCQRTYVGAYQHGADETRTPWRCATVVAQPWEVSVRSRVRSSTTGTNYVDRTGDLNVKVGESVYWQHTIINNTDYNAPGPVAGGAAGYTSFGYSLAYGDITDPNAYNPDLHYVRRLGNNHSVTISARSNGQATENSYYSSSTEYEGYVGLNAVYGQNTDGSNMTYSHADNGQPPVHKLIKPGDVGKRFCQRAYVGMNKDATRGGEKIRANSACAYVPYDYELRPCMVLGTTTTCGGTDIPQERGTSANPQPRVNNDGGTTTRPTQWKVSQWEVPASRETATTPSDNTDNNNSDPCAVFNGIYGITQAQSGCDVTHEGERTFNATTTLSNQINNLVVPNDAELGKRYCFALSINPFKFDDGQDKGQQDTAAGQWRHSPPICILVVKKPKMQVWSNGIYSESGIKTSRSTINGETFGSWVEYEALAAKRIVGFTSEASTTTNRLTLANNSATTKGDWGTWNAADAPAIISNLEARYPYAGTPGSSMVFREVAGKNAEVGKTTATNYVLNTTSSFTRSQPGRTVIVMAGNADVHINRDIISRNPTSGNVSDFQQFIIIGRNIYIGKDVGQIDAWLISSGNVVTCAAPNGGGQLRADPGYVTQQNCGNRLRINGPIITNSLKSWRTGGGDAADLDQPSEVYNQRPDAYIWAYGQSGGDGKVITTYSKELPVRF